ncbi:DNA-3-methyladenine glycosylase [Phtheirospermum japonicum]|uniref:DNA-3-methyladenine glycosylase II n=1 Tax=Phtheirospermum japonicum TaxID=374723 RepID=A0A830BW34_9LAMI|nr:DNA-3-methyladenine glycosylase [Phtheirospermum japonicum]
MLSPKIKFKQLFYSILPSSKFTSFPSQLTPMNKKTAQNSKKAVKIRNPTKTIKKPTTTTTVDIVVAPKRRSTAKPSSHLQENDETLPTTSISSDFLGKNPILSPDFYQIDALDLAPRLLGKHIRKDDVILRITEVEAYRPNDSACHGRFGITARTAPVIAHLVLVKSKTYLSTQFGAGGHAYVYLCYGMHNMLNVVADKKGNGAAVLIRSCAPVCGLETIQRRRGLKSEKPVLLAGPGKVGQALGISTEWSNHPLFTPGGLELLDGPEPEKILVGPRVGIEYALPEHVNALWRFAIDGSPWISAPRNTLRPP